MNYGVTQHSIVHDVSHSIINDTLTIFAIVENKNFIDIDTHCLWKSTNNGLTWSKCLTYDNFGKNGGYKEIFISPHNPSEIWFFDGPSKYFSTDGGNRWIYAFNYLQNIKSLDNSYRGGFADNIIGLDFDNSNKDIIYYWKGNNEVYLYRFDRTTQNSTLLCDMGYFPSFAADFKNSKNMITANYKISKDGGWTWNSYREKLNVLMDKHIFMNNAKNEVLSYFKNEIRIKLSLGLSFILNSKDNGENWEIESSFDGKINAAYINPNNPQNMIAIKELSEKYGSFLGLSVLLTEDAHKWTPILEYFMPDGINSSNYGFYESYYSRCALIKSKDVNTI